MTSLAFVMSEGGKKDVVLVFKKFSDFYLRVSIP